MKIGIVIMHALNTRSSRYAIEVSDYFARAGHEVHIFANRFDKLNEKVNAHKIPAISKNFWLQEASFNVLSTVITKKYSFDVTMAQATRFFSPDVCYMQFVYKAWLDYTKSRLGFGLINKAIAATECHNLRKAKRIITMSQQVKNQIIKYYGIPEEKIRIIYSGVDLDFFNPKNRKVYRKEIREKFGLAESDIVLLFAGNPYSRKGLQYLVEALPLIRKDVKLLVVGRDLGEDKIANYQRAAEKLGVSEKLIYCGFAQEINKYFAAADVFVLPSLYEPFGLVVLEAMASGLPIVVSARAGAAEIVSENEGLLINNPESAEETAEKINFLLSKNISLLGRNARKKAEQFTWLRTAEEMLSVFENIIE